MSQPAPTTPTFIRPEDRATIMDACEAIRDACNRLNQERQTPTNKKKKAA